MTLVDLRGKAVTAMPSSKRRKPVMDGLEKVVERLTRVGVKGSVWVDGSFLTKKIDPDDSDILAVIDGAFYDAANAEQKAAIEWLNGDLKTGFLCHSFVHFERPPGHPEHEKSVWMRAYWLRQFGFTRKDDPKGIAVINLP
jgi:hypothetical protein